MKAKGLVVFLALAAVSLQARALTLDEYLQKVRSTHKGLQALAKSKDAASLRREAGDIELSPVLTASARKIDDQKPTPFGTFLLDRSEATQYSLGVAKKFSTGTQAEVTAKLDETKTTATDFSADPPASFGSEIGSGALGISLSQSLWKDFFGNATRLRQERQAVVESSERQNYDLQSLQILVDAESAFWDYLYFKDELAAREDALDRAKKIEVWIRRRVSNGIGDEADLFNAQGLVASRQLQLQTTQNDIRSAEKRVRDLMELGSEEVLPELKGDFGSNRSMDQMAQGGKGRRVRLDAYLAVLEAKTRAISAREVEDAYRPDLVLEGSYNTNSSETSMSDASRHLGDTDKPTTMVGLRFSWALDWTLRDAAKGTARAEALAAVLKQERAMLESDSSWSEIKRHHEELTRQIQTAQQVNELQNKKASAQRNKLSKGRTITSDVILAEQDAAEAHLNLNKLRAEQRKLEAQGRLYVTMEE